MKLVSDNIPAELKCQGLFCGWKYIQKKGKEKPDKFPINVKTGKGADSSDPNTFVSFEKVVELFSGTGGIEKGLEAKGYDGLGVGIFDNLVGIDIDHCIDQDGKLSEMAADIVEQTDTYAEKSPSGTGLRLIGYAPNCEYDIDEFYQKNDKKGLEIYISGITKGRFLTITGNTLCDKPVRDISKELKVVAGKYMKRTKSKKKDAVPVTVQIDMSDTELLDKMLETDEEASRLYSGDMTGFESQSSADLSLCNKLAFWFGRDPERMDRIFRTSGLMRKKWDERRGRDTYGNLTINEAISTCDKVYDPNYKRNKNGMKNDYDLNNLLLDWDDEISDDTNYWADGLKTMKDNHSEGDSSVKADTDQEDHASVKQSPFNLVKGSDLVEMELPPIVYCVGNMIPIGETVVASAPKVGKSWLMLDLCLSVAEGRPFWGHEARKSHVVYMNLEDSKQYGKDRLLKVLNGRKCPEGFYMITDGDTDEDETKSVKKIHYDPKTGTSDPNKGLIKQLTDLLEYDPEIKLIVIDTLKYIKPGCPKGTNIYDFDYEVGRILKKWADKNEVSLIVITHTSQYNHTDVLQNVSGSSGVTGASDCVWILHKEKRGTLDANIMITGRRVREAEYDLTFSESTFTWNNNGKTDPDKKKTEEQEEQEREYLNSDFRKKLIKFMKSRDQWAGRCGKLKEEALSEGVCFMIEPKAIGTFLKDINNRTFLFDKDNIKVSVHEHKGSSCEYTIENMTLVEIAKKEGFELAADTDTPFQEKPQGSEQVTA